LLLGHTKLESTVRYLCIEVDDALEMAEQTEVRMMWPVNDHLIAYRPQNGHQRRASGFRGGAALAMCI